MTERHDENLEAARGLEGRDGGSDAPGQGLYNPYAPQGPGALAGSGGYAAPGETSGSADGGEPARESVWDLMLGVFTSPGKAMAQVAAQRPVGTAALLVIGLTLFSVVMGLFSAQGVTPADLGDLPPGMPPEFLEAMNAMLPSMALFATAIGAVVSILWWFARSAIYGLIGELMGLHGDGRAMLATLGFASLPVLLQAPIDLMLIRLGLGWLSTLVGIGFWVWSVILSVLAIQAALRTGTGRAIVVYIVPVAVGVGLFVLAALLFAGSIFTLINTMPMP